MGQEPSQRGIATLLRCRGWVKDSAADAGDWGIDTLPAIAVSND